MTWSEKESDGSQEEYNMVNNQVAFSRMLVSGNCVLVQGCLVSVTIDVACMFVKSNTIATNNKTPANSLCGSDSDNGDESENDDESL